MTATAPRHVAPVIIPAATLAAIHRREYPPCTTCNADGVAAAFDHLGRVRVEYECPDCYGTGRDLPADAVELP